MGKKKFKEYKEYICPKCKKNFGNYKYHYEVHINKKKPCDINFIEIENNNNISENFKHDENLINANNNQNINNNLDIDIDNQQLNFNNIEIIDNKNIIIELMKKMDYLIKQNEEFKHDVSELKEDNKELKEDNKELKEDIDKLKNQIQSSSKTNKNDITNYINVNIQINNFNDIDYSKMNAKTLIKTLIKEQGKQIILKTIQDIFVNPDKPENHNIYVADKNRKYLKTYNNNKWNTDDFKIIDRLIEKFVNIYKLSIEEIKKDIKLYDRIKKSIQDKMKYLNYCDLEYLGELEYEQDNGDIDNKDEIKRCKEFYEMVHNDVVNLLHDNKNIILNTHKSIMT
jgi:hypothetical protein